jgi:hypothetical protein
MYQHFSLLYRLKLDSSQCANKLRLLIPNGELHVNLCSCSHHWYEGGDNMAISDVM